MIQALRLRCSMRIGGAAAAMCMALSPSPAATQSELATRIELDVTQDYMWRGISTNQAEAAIEVSAWHPLGGGHFGVGAWALGLPIWTEDPVANRRAPDGELVSLNNELDLWAEYGWEPGGMTVSIGIVRYFVNDYSVDRESDESLANTTEIYGRLRPRNLHLTRRAWVTPGVNIYYDVERVGGGYAELVGSLRLPVSENRGVRFAALFGFNLSQSSDGSGAGYFDKRGLAISELSLSTPLWLSTRSVSSAVGLAYRWPGGSQLQTDPAGKGFELSLTISAGRL